MILRLNNIFTELKNINENKFNRYKEIVSKNRPNTYIEITDEINKKKEVYTSFFLFISFFLIYKNLCNF